METDAKEQLDLFCEASSMWKQLAISNEKKSELLDVLAILFAKIISEQPNELDKEENHAR